MSKKITYPFLYLLSSGISFLTLITIGQDNIDGESRNLLSYLIFQVGAGFINVISGFYKEKLYFFLKNTKIIIAILFIASLFDSKLLIFLSGSIVSIIYTKLIFGKLGYTVAYLNLLNSTIIFIGSLLIKTDYNLKLDYFIFISAIIVILTSLNVKNSLFLHDNSCNLKKINCRIKNYSIIVLAFSFSLSNVIIYTIFNGHDNLMDFIIIEKFIGSVAIALNSYYMNEFFLKSFNRISLLKSIYLLAVFFILSLAFIYSYNYMGAIISANDISFNYVAIIFISVGWVINLHSSRYLRLLQTNNHIYTRSYFLFFYILVFNLILFFLFNLYFYFSQFNTFYGLIYYTFFWLNIYIAFKFLFYENTNIN